MTDDDPEVIGNPDVAVPYTGTSSAEYPPPPPPEGYTLDQWIAERKIRADNALARANERLAEEMRQQRPERLPYGTTPLGGPLAFGHPSEMSWIDELARDHYLPFVNHHPVIFIATVLFFAAILGLIGGFVRAWLVG